MSVPQQGGCNGQGSLPLAHRSRSWVLASHTPPPTPFPPIKPAFPPSPFLPHAPETGKPEREGEEEMGASDNDSEFADFVNVDDVCILRLPASTPSLQPRHLEPPLHALAAALCRPSTSPESIFDALNLLEAFLEDVDAGSAGAMVGVLDRSGVVDALLGRYHRDEDGGNEDAEQILVFESGEGCRSAGGDAASLRVLAWGCRRSTDVCKKAFRLVPDIQKLLARECSWIQNHNHDVEIGSLEHAEAAVLLVTAIACSLPSSHTSLVYACLLSLADVAAIDHAPKELRARAVEFCFVVSQLEETRPLLPVMVPTLQHVAASNDHALNFVSATLAIANMEAYLHESLLPMGVSDLDVVELAKEALSRSLQGSDFPPGSDRRYNDAWVCAAVANMLRVESRRGVAKELLETVLQSALDTPGATALHDHAHVALSLLSCKQDNQGPSWYTGHHSDARKGRREERRSLRRQSAGSGKGSGEGAVGARHNEGARQVAARRLVPRVVEASDHYHRLYLHFVPPPEGKMCFRGRLPPHVEPFTLKHFSANPSNYELEGILAVGGYAEISRATTRGCRSAVAIKFQGIPEGRDEEEGEELKDMIGELSILRHFSNAPNIARYHGSFLSKGNVATVLELYAHGNLRQFLRAHKTSWRQRVRIAKDVCNALVQLHANSIIHRDVKTENILIGGDLGAVLCDFGFAIYDQCPERLWTCSGTETYIAPEVLLGHSFGCESDIFSFGVCLCELVTTHETGGRFLRRNKSPDPAARRQDVESRLLAGCPAVLPKLALKACGEDPKTRPSAVSLHRTLASLEVLLPAECDLVVL